MPTLWATAHSNDRPDRPSSDLQGVPHNTLRDPRARSEQMPNWRNHSSPPVKRSHRRSAWAWGGPDLGAVAPYRRATADNHPLLWFLSAGVVDRMVKRWCSSHRLLHPVVPLPLSVTTLLYSTADCQVLGNALRGSKLWSNRAHTAIILLEPSPMLQHPA